MRTFMCTMQYRCRSQNSWLQAAEVGVWFFVFNLRYVGVFVVSACLSVRHVWAVTKQGIGFPGTRVPGGCELPCGC